MEFCKNCNNKLYLIEEDNKLHLRCKKCGFQKRNRKSIIYTKTYNYVESTVDTVNNKYIVHCSPLPRTNRKKCPNRECISHNDKSKNEAIFYPDKNTRELNYVCCNCYSTWKFS